MLQVHMLQYSSIQFYQNFELYSSCDYLPLHNSEKGIHSNARTNAQASELHLFQRIPHHEDCLSERQSVTSARVEMRLLFISVALCCCYGSLLSGSSGVPA